MNKSKLPALLFLATLSLLAVHKVVNAFPPQCVWNLNSNFICNKGGLTNIPEDIPKSAYKIDLSNNIMLKFEDDFFLKFHNLQKLYLNNCSLTHAFLLPSSLRILKLNQNALNKEAVKKMFAGDLRYIRTIELDSNNLLLDQILEFIPRRTLRLSLRFNKLPEMRRSHFLGFRKLSFLSLVGNNLNVIAPHSLDSLVKLRRLDLRYNNLRSLPKDCFSQTKKLIKLQLATNRFSSVPDLKGLVQLKALDLGDNQIRKISRRDFYMQSITHLYLEHNRIESFDLRRTRYLRLDLSFNRIRRLESFAFRGRKRLMGLRLQNNTLSYISPLAFKGMTEISSLYLHKNLIQMLPRNVFKNLMIERLFLYGNNISSMNGVLNEMRSPPLLVLLFSVPQLKVFNSSDFITMKTGSKLLITCNNLQQISGHVSLQADVQCFPPVNFTITSTDKNMENDGFKCLLQKLDMRKCFPCPLGSFITDTPCKECPPGSFYQDEFGLNYCKSCPSGQYVPPDKSPGKSPLDCLTCPDGTEKTRSAGHRACSCIEGFARTDRFGKCHQCIENGISCTNDYPMLKKDYWWTWHHGFASDLKCRNSFENFIRNLDVKDDSYDRKSSTFSCALPKPHLCPIRGACFGGLNSACHQSYKGVLCSVCKTGYSRHWQKCTKCPTRWMAGLQFFGYVALFFVICALISWADKIRLSENDDQSRTFADVILSNIKILLGFYQVLSAILQAFSFVSWPNSLRKAIEIFQLVQFQVFSIPSLSCINPDWGLNAVHEFWIALVGTAAVPTIILVYYTIKKLYLHRSTTLHQVYVNESRKCKENCLRVLMLFLFVTYPLTSQKVVQILPISCHNICTVMEQGVCLHQLSYLRADYSVKCLTTSDLTLLFAYTATIIPLGLPIVILVLLMKYAPKGTGIVNELQEDLLNAPYPGGKENSLQFAIKFLYENYNVENRYWEALEMLRKIIMTAGVTLFIGYYKMGIGITIAVTGGFAVAHAYRRPMQNKFENMVQLCSLSIIPINLCLGVVLKWNPSNGEGEMDGDENWKLGIFLVSLNAVVFLLIACRILKDLAQVMMRFCSKRGGNEGYSRSL